jgi:hypothetical protein
LSVDGIEKSDLVVSTLQGQQAAGIDNRLLAEGMSQEAMELLKCEGSLPWQQLYDRQGQLRYQFGYGAEPGELERRIEELLAE